jgi:RNA polymerase sigma factor (sigma-70 family)
VLDDVMRSDRGRLLSVLAAGLRDLSLAEEVLQEAAVSALSHWGRAGLPNSPQGWLLQVARRKAIDRLRGNVRDTRKSEALAQLAHEEATPEPDDIPDERLRLIFACCHPALEMKSRVALTLRSVCGLTTQEIARAFLDQDTTMGQRLSRAKAKIAGAGIPFKIPEEQEWPDRLDGVLTTIYLIFTTGYVADAGEPRDLCREAEFLLRLIDHLRPEDPECEGALALVLLTSARRNARIGADGASVPPSEQDRSLWDHDRIAQGRALLERAMRRGRPGPYQIKAAIADCHHGEDGPDWRQILALYHVLWTFEPTAIIALNSAVALAEAGYPKESLSHVEGLGEALSDYQPYHAAHAELLAKNGHTQRAVKAYTRAIADAPTQSEALFLTKRLTRLGA